MRPLSERLFAGSETRFFADRIPSRIPGEEAVSEWETDNYRTAEHAISLEIDQGSGPITIR